MALLFFFLTVVFLYFLKQRSPIVYRLPEQNVTSIIHDFVNLKVKMQPLCIHIKQLGLWYVEIHSQKSCKSKLLYPKAPQCVVGGPTCVRLRVLLVVTWLIVIVECLFLQRALRSGVHYHHWSYGHFRWPFQQATFGGKNIRFTPTNSSNLILRAHSCGLGGKYWYKHPKVFQTEHLKRPKQSGLKNLTFFAGRSYIFSSQSETSVISV